MPMSARSRRSNPRLPPSPSSSSSSDAVRASPHSSPPSRLRPPSANPDVSSNILLFLIGFRLVNALTVRTFFQPDEFFQSLEPAWKIAFGTNQGPWITWEWEHQLRSSLHPLIFAAVYTVADLVARTLGLTPTSRAELLIAGPGITQAVIAAVGDFYTWKLARYIYGDRSHESWATVRIRSNAIEADADQLQLALTVVSLASVALYRSAWGERQTLAREALICGSSVLAVSTVVDRFFYGFWTFPPLRFLYFNVAQSLAAFYGRNDWSYYASQGYPLLLTTALPFTLVGLYRTLKTPPKLEKQKGSILVQLASISLAMPATLSVITHKEVRFIYPLLPALHILSASPLVEFFIPALTTTNREYISRRLTLIFLLWANVAIAIYTTLFHASGVISVLSYIREQHQIHGTANIPSLPKESPASYGGITTGFLMPCHSTPWRSHLVEPTIHAWALSCEPPVGLTAEEKAAYRDEADQFYDNPTQFLQDNMVGGLRHIPRRPSYATPPSSQRQPTQLFPPHEWPDYLVFFAQLEPTLKDALRGSSYGECWRTFNSAWHDDSRRRGDVVVWCLDHAKQQAWQSQKHQRELEDRDRQFDHIIKRFQRDATPSKSWHWSHWTSPFSSQSKSWSWPWERKKRTLFGYELPDLPQWGWFGKRKKKTLLSDFWF
ncbi:hypothetical protein AN1811.2 [Aspergillus nidulans FGSC A4]|uniref:GPI mannosyltransferase 3 n=1 Tax=Emericella nidulans (strain FGSC A4 / ATCC 38163 / CBS 112.46 / NRRL 194 / M139) TaxID=227321 RepID=GPI10_EMENI|nr:hypothetical protein [Aspergillus nidulans FGSC A4]Q5BCB9.1 RecName: Full=GPI mannosyltransferase 3; AltName: Full=GPI mannosyltransferase III; Short=GPI-MT-III; AltName: Full=Glycosylphosphatidylinositol-anchor biosynthesis protein 10 [Aspergillus nidulans FGSC A4]EAA64976.1 hypothetical protein AN1811.2 [Aspergillus nidulans FGSC A4]CBF85606.1 TPA: GPI mannosyltransferase 3 (EC 2.4.1.-)(GPI mannosyltransferase III)(GPI-MT-III)(Glycosylphosphatidylinositol-anchor biosynthesis protein 10) [So|eukprot:XP_659415.1 hypothetical protein AN1811.2 [Aspergillus nidulans FGSC A4]